MLPTVERRRFSLSLFFLLPFAPPVFWKLKEEWEKGKQDACMLVALLVFSSLSVSARVHVLRSLNAEAPGPEKQQTSPS